ncbi:hypothetical protein D3C80_1223730 [compost metagenome]
MRPYFAYCAFLHALLHAVFSTSYRIFLSQYVNELCKAVGFKQYALGFPALIA